MKLYVANIRYDCTEDEFKKFCETLGRVLYVALPRNYETERGRGFGFVTYAEELDYDRILDRMNRLQFQGRVLSVALAYQRDSDS